MSDEECLKFTVTKVEFNYETMRWVSRSFVLPMHNGDYVLLTPKSLLTRDDTFINRTDMVRNLQQIAPSVTDAAAVSLIKEHPELIDYYLK